MTEETMVEISARDLIELRDLKDRIVRLRDEARSLARQNVGIHDAMRYSAIAHALTVLLEDGE